MPYRRQCSTFTVQTARKAVSLSTAAKTRLSSRKDLYVQRMMATRLNATESSALIEPSSSVTDILAYLLDDADCKEIVSSCSLSLFIISRANKQLHNFNTSLRL